MRLDNLQHGCMFLFLLWPACLLDDCYAMLPKDKSNIFLVICKVSKIISYTAN